MKHKRIEQLIQKSLDFEINQDEKRILHDHIAKCPECKQYYESMNDLQQQLGMLTEFYPEVGFNDRVRKALGLAKRFVWKKVALVFSSAWIASLIALVFIPYHSLINKTLTSIPAVVRLADSIKTVILTLSHALAPLAKSSINPIYIALGILVSIGVFYIFGKTIKKEEQCKV